MSDAIKRLKAEDRNDSYNSFSAAINSREQLTPKTNAQSYAIELNELKRKEAGDYDPYDHSDIEHPTTNFETLIHLLKSSFGTGILAMPLAFYHSGYILGIIGTSVIGLLCTYCMHMLVRTEYELCKRKKVPSLTYPGTAEAALAEGPPFLAKLAPYSGIISNVFLLMYQLGSSCVYIVFISENIWNVVNNYWQVNERLIFVMLLLPLILVTFVKNLKLLVPLTSFANFITVVSFGIIYYYIFQEPITFEGRLAIGQLTNMPLFFGTVMFALESIGMVSAVWSLTIAFLVGLAVLIPYIDLFISLVGALCISALGLAFPAIFDSSTKWYHLDDSLKWWIHGKNLLIVLTISNTFLLLYQLGICCVYTVFVAENIKNVLDQYMANPVDERIIMVIILLPLVFINYIKNLKFLAPLTIVANVLTFVSFAIIFYFIFSKKVTLEDREPIGDYRDFPLYFGTVLFALEAIGMIMPLKNEMKSPQNFGSCCGVLNIGMLAVVVLYMMTGLFGYLAYGKHVLGSISYTIDPENIAAQVCKLMLAVAIFTTHALSMYVAIDIVWTQNLLRRFEKSYYVNIWEYAIRTCLVVLTFGLAVAIPYIDLFISLVGALCISCSGIAFPAIMDSCVQWQSHRGVKMVLIHAKNVAIALFALLGLVVGTATSLEKIIEKFGPIESNSLNSTST
ncbi:hypothetical protein YQE_03637, partial [Dendroctonus ponderosae]